MLARVDLGLPATGSIGACVPVRYKSRTACEGQLMYRGLITNRTGKVGRIRVIVIATMGGGGTKVNLLPYPILFADDLLHTFHRLPCLCVT